MALADMRTKYAQKVRCAMSFKNGGESCQNNPFYAVVIEAAGMTDHIKKDRPTAVIFEMLQK